MASMLGDIKEDPSSSSNGFNARGQGEKKKTNSQSTSLTISRVGLTSAPISLTGTQTGLIGVSREPRNSSKTKNKTRPSFKELRAKYEKNGAAQKKKKQLCEAIVRTSRAIGFLSTSR